MFSYVISVTAAWLMERYSLSRKLIIDELRPFDKGTDSKHLYDPNEVIPILENLNRQKTAAAVEKEELKWGLMPYITLIDQK